MPELNYSAGRHVVGFSHTCASARFQENRHHAADCSRLTSIHVNRMLKALEREGFIARSQRSVRIVDFRQLARVGDFDPRYLHLEQAERDETSIGTGS